MSRRGSRSPFEAIRTEGGLLPHDLLQRIAARDPKLPGMKDADYGLLEHEREGEIVNRAWTRLLAAWTGFRAALENEPPDAPATKITRDRWLLPLFQALDFGRLSGRQPFDLEGRVFPISHEHEATDTAIHLLGARVSLDVKSQAVQGAAKTTPHGLVQDFLNRSSAHDWAIVTNGLVLRLLRDNKSITRQAYLEFDLEEILDDERYSEFRVLWLVCHESRFRRDGDAACLLEQWFERGKEEGVRALDRLRNGVEEAIRVLGGGFLRHRDNAPLRDALGSSGSLDPQEYYRQLLRLVYRLIFIFVTEDRDVLLDPTAPPEARDRYTRHYATSHLRALATRRRGGPHKDLWMRLKLIMDRLYGGCPELGLPALGSFLWKPEAIGILHNCTLANEDLLSALRMLVEVSDGKVVHPVAWAQVGADELGSVYESLLELHPRIEREAGTFDLGTAAGHERRATGSYYTPASLVECLLDSALDPLLLAKSRSPNPEAAILEMRVCDPACGSGHFLVAAARRIAKRLAAVRSGDNEPSPANLRRALRDVVGRCIFGVDLNPMAVELCKVSLWLEAVEPGRPLSFLDAHIQPGNSLLGATPASIARGIPDSAFQPLEGDDKEVCKRIRKLNREQRKQSHLPFGQGGVSEFFNVLVAKSEDVERQADASILGVEAKARLWDGLRDSEDFRRAELLASAWCSAFVWRMVPGPLERAAVTVGTLSRMASGDRLPETEAEVVRLKNALHFFHWHLAFPQVFSVPQSGERTENETTGWSGGFDVVLGNPPWERLKLQEAEFFASRRPEIARAANAAARKKLIAQLPSTDPGLWEAWCLASREAEGHSHLARESGLFPLCGKGDVNTYAIFAEAMRNTLSPTGRVGCIVPSGIATDDTTKEFFSTLVESKSLVSLFDFKNRDELFYDVGHRRFKFCLLTFAGSPQSEAAVFTFFADRAGDVHDARRRFTLSSEDIRTVNPNTRTCPTFRSGHDAALNLSMYRHAGVLWLQDVEGGNPWGLRFMAMFHMSGDSDLFLTRTELPPEGPDESHLMPLMEGKLVHHYDHRYGDYADRLEDSENTSLPDVPVDRLQDPDYRPTSRYWVPAAEVTTRLEGVWSRGWVLGWRDITHATNERTLISGVAPMSGFGDTFLLMFPGDEHVERACCLLANLSAFILDYTARLKIGTLHLKYHTVRQLPVLSPSVYSQPCPWEPGLKLEAWLRPRVVELTYTANDIAAFAKDAGYEGPPFRWDTDRRRLLRAELDAAFFHLYRLVRADVDYVMETFPRVRMADERAHGEFITKRLILEAFDAMAEGIRGDTPYASPLDPPPGSLRAAHPARVAGERAGRK